MHRLLLALLVLLAVPVSASALAPGQLFGVGDNNAASMFSNPLYTALKPSVTRYIAPYDVARTPGFERDRLDTWYVAARAAKQRPMIALGSLYGKRKPSAKAYSRAFASALKRYPKAEWAAWNEANHSSQPTGKSPKTAAMYYRIAKKRCPRCTIVGLTVVLTRNSTSYTKRFLAALPKRMRGRIIFGVHNYGDANRKTDKSLRDFLKRFPRGQVWLTESGTWAKFAGSWKWNLTRQAKTAKYVFTAAKKYRKRVKRVYWYQLIGPGKKHRWDSGLLNNDGSTRLSYGIVRKYRFR